MEPGGAWQSPRPREITSLRDVGCGLGVGGGGRSQKDRWEGRWPGSQLPSPIAPDSQAHKSLWGPRLERL